MAIRGFSINISDKITGKQATCFAQWIGAANVMRNQKRTEYVDLLAENKKIRKVRSCTFGCAPGLLTQTG